jgi:hypothetical protein
MAPYCCGARRQSISLPSQLWPVTARFGAFTVRPCRWLGERSVTRSVAMSAARSQRPIASSVETSVLRAVAAASSSAGASARRASVGRSILPLKCHVVRNRPSSTASRAAARKKSPAGGGAARTTAVTATGCSRLGACSGSGV